MKQKILIVIIMLIALTVMASCVPTQDTPSRRVAQLQSPQEATQETTQEPTQEPTQQFPQEADPAPGAPQLPTPALNVDQEILNCDDNSQQCHTQEITDPFNDPNGIRHRINSLMIVTDNSILTNVNTGLAPAISFQIQDLTDENINSLTYSYEKRDSLGNVLAQNTPQTLYKTNNSYIIPIHSNTLGVGVLTSAPYEKHIITIRIVRSDNHIFSHDIEFYVYSHAPNPVLFDRKSDILNSSYYKMDANSEDFTIDMIEVQNTLPYPVTTSGNIHVSNTTLAVVSDTTHQQQKNFIPKINFYPWDSYGMHTIQSIKYYQAAAVPIYSIKVHRGANEEFIPITATYSGNEIVLVYNNLYLQGNEKIQMDVMIHVNTNNSVLGGHGQTAFYEGTTLCNNPTPTSSCFCFYFPLYHYFPHQSQADLYYGPQLCGIYYSPYQSTYYPNCASSPGQCASKNLDITYYPEDLYQLVGRHHLTNTTYVITSWLKDYENYDELGTTTKTMDPLEIIKGYVNYGAIDHSQSFSGYMPGIL